MHLHYGELLLAAVYFAAAMLILVGIFRTHAPRKNTRTPVQRIEPPVKRIERKRDTKKKAA